MKTIVRASILVAIGGAAPPAVADETPPAPVTLPEESDSAPAAVAPTEGSAPAASTPKSPAAEQPAPQQAAAPRPAPVQSAAPPPLVAAPAVPPAVAPVQSSPPRDSGVRRSTGPINSRFNIGANVDTVWYTGPSYDFFSERNNESSPGVSAGYAIWMDHPLSIVPELGWSTHGVHQDALYGGAITRAELKTHNAYGGLSIRYEIISILEAHVRVAGGATFLNSSVQPNAVSPKLEQDDVLPFGTLGGGVTVHSPAGALETRSGKLRSVLAGVTFEGGYRLGASADLTPQPTEEPGRIPTRYMSLGTLERSGPYFRTSLVVRF